MGIFGDIRATWPYRIRAKSLFGNQLEVVMTVSPLNASCHDGLNSCEFSDDCVAGGGGRRPARVEEALRCWVRGRRLRAAVLRRRVRLGPSRRVSAARN